MSTKTELANRAAIASWIRKRAAAILADTKRDLADIMDEGDRSYAIVDGDKIGTVSVSSPEVKPAITDPAAFTAWVKANKPDAIEETVADWYKATANLAAVIAKTGEVPDGVEMVAGAPTVSVRVSGKQEEALSELLQINPNLTHGLLEDK